jgi:hypothetical protein
MIDLEKPHQDGFEPTVKFEQIFEAMDPARRKSRILGVIG